MMMINLTCRLLKAFFFLLVSIISFQLTTAKGLVKTPFVYIFFGGLVKSIKLTNQK